MRTHRWRQGRDFCSIQGAANLNSFAENTVARCDYESEAVAAATQSCLLQILAISIGQGLANEPIAQVDVEAYRDFRAVRILCPALDPVGRDPINIAAEG